MGSEIRKGRIYMRALTDGRMEHGPWRDQWDPVSQRRRWPVWLVVLAVCGAPIALPLAVGGAALIGGVLLCLLTFITGAGVAGVMCVGAGAVSFMIGLAGLFVNGLKWGLYYLGGGMAASLLGVFMLTLFAGGVFLCHQVVVWFLRHGNGDG